MKGRWSVLLVLVSVALISAPLGEAWSAKLDVARMAICTAVEEREPVGADSVFVSESERLFCFTELRGARDSTSVTHVWLYDGKKMAEVTLPVKSMRWRTWSSKKLVPAWKGDWMVKVLGAEGEVLAEKAFTIE